jgi:uncharacterized protein
MGAGFVTIEVVARPASQRRGLLRVESRGLVIGVVSPAEKGQANEELIATVADMVEVPRGEVAILRGTSARTKVIRIATTEPAQIAERLYRINLKAKQR